MVAGAMDYTSVYEAADVTEEMLKLADFIYDQWFCTEADPIDWAAFLSRMEGQMLEDGSILDFPLNDTPAIHKIQAHVRARRAAS